MAWLAVDKDGGEFIYSHRPTRNEEDGIWGTQLFIESYVYIPKGSIKKLIGRELNWEDDPVEI